MEHLFLRPDFSGKKRRAATGRCPAKAPQFSFLLLVLFSFLFIITIISACGNGKSGKIKLHRRDSADAAIAGKWILNKDLLKPQNLKAAAVDTVTSFVLHEDHSALIYTDNSSNTPFIRGKWSWIAAGDSGTSSALPAAHNGILITNAGRTDSSVVLRLTKGAAKEQEVLIVHGGGNVFKKEMRE